MSTFPEVYDDLEEIPFRFRDGSTHFYHPKSDKIYSFNNFKEIWYNSSFANEIKFRYLEPEKYKQKQKEEQEKYDEEQIKYEEYVCQFKTTNKLLKEYSNDKFEILITKNFINDIIKNKLYDVLINNIMTLDAQYYYYKEHDYKENGLSIQDHMTIIDSANHSIRNCDIIYNIKSINNDLKVHLSGDTLKVNQNEDLILLTGTGLTAYSNIEFSENIKYNGLSFAQELKNKLYNYKLIYPYDNKSIITHDGIIFIVNR